MVEYLFLFDKDFQLARPHGLHEDVVIAFTLVSFLGKKSRFREVNLLEEDLPGPAQDVLDESFADSSLEAVHVHAGLERARSRPGAKTIKSGL